jgi:hypothetical protein
MTMSEGKILLQPRYNIARLYPLFDCITVGEALFCCKFSKIFSALSGLLLNVFQVRLK